MRGKRSQTLRRRPCVRKGCKNPVYGQQQVCDKCQAKDKLCRTCGRPHGGPATTKLCKPCQAARRGRPRSPRNPPWTEAEDKLIRDVYAKHHAREAMRVLRTHFPARPRWSISRRAQLLGAATCRVKERPWSEAEDAILQNVGWMTPERIAVHLRAAGFSRSLTGISLRMRRTRVREKIDSITANGLAQLLNLDLHTILRWIRSGWIEATRAGTTGDNHDRYHLTTAAVRAFLLAHPEKYELSKLERAGSKLWFLEMVTNGRISESGEGSAPIAPAVTPDRTVPLLGEQVTLSALADISGRSLSTLIDRLDRQGLSVQEAAFGDIAEAPTKGATSPAGKALARDLRALLKRHKARTADLVTWSKLPRAVIDHLLTGTFPVLPAIVTTLAEILDAKAEIRLVPNAR